jgi:hypothetical protein
LPSVILSAIAYNLQNQCKAKLLTNLYYLVSAGVALTFAVQSILFYFTASRLVRSYHKLILSEIENSKNFISN